FQRAFGQGPPFPAHRPADRPTAPTTARERGRPLFRRSPIYAGTLSATIPVEIKCSPVSRVKDTHQARAAGGTSLAFVLCSGEVLPHKWRFLKQLPFLRAPQGGACAFQRNRVCPWPSGIITKSSTSLARRLRTR